MDHRPAGRSAARGQSQKAILKQLLEADIFEQMLQTLYIGTKRFSLEGNTALIPLMEEILSGAAAHGARRVRDGHEPSRTADRGVQHRGPLRDRYLRRL